MALALLGALLVHACVPGNATELVVRIDTDIQPNDLLSVELVVRPPGDNTTPRFRRLYSIAGSDAFSLPGDVGIVAADINDMSRVQVELTARLRTGDVFTRTALVSFQRRRILVLEMFLAARCRLAAARLICGPTETCGRLACESQSVPVFDIDAGGRADVGVDAVRDAPVNTDAMRDARGDTVVDTSADASCATGCDDSVFCNGIETCVDGRCLPGSPPSCDDSIDCTRDACPAGGSACTHAADHGLCTAGVMGMCVATTGCQYATCSTATCVSNACATRMCVSGVCTSTPACAVGQMCCGGACVVAGCDDRNPCTADSCTATGCAHVATSGAVCDDGNVCTTVDRCAGATCTGSSPRDCNDGNPCTTDTCVNPGGCVRTPNTLACDDGNACTTNDRCGGGTCAGAAIDCNDGVSCNMDVCSAGICTHPPVAGACSAGVCNEGGCCSTGPCQFAPQCGCLPGRACYTSASTGAYCSTPGLPREGQLCTGPEPQGCSAGNACGYSGNVVEPAICFRYCLSDSDCASAAGSRCLATAAGRLCSHRCDPVSNIGCPAPYVCKISQTGTLVHTACVNNPGAGGQGSTCPDPNDCGGAFACVSGFCRHWCHRGSSADCPGGTTCRILAGVMIGADVYDACN